MDAEKFRLLCPFFSDETITCFESYSLSQLKSEKSRDSYGYLIAGICNFSECDFLELSPSRIVNYFNEKEKECSINTLQWQMGAFRGYSKYLDHRLTAMGQNPIYYQMFSYKGFSFEDAAPQTLDIPSYKEVNQVLELLKAEGNTMCFTAMALALRCALTSEEICSLKREQIIVDTAGHYGIHFINKKKEERFVKLPEDIINLLGIHIRNIPLGSSYLFLNKRGAPISIRYLQQKILNACRAAGVKSFTMQHLRNLSAGQMFASGAPAQSLSYYIDIGQEWIHRYNKYVPELESAAVDYSHIRVQW